MSDRLCGKKESINNIEWVCVRPVHDKANERHNLSNHGLYPQSKQHYMKPFYALTIQEKELTKYKET